VIEVITKRTVTIVVVLGALAAWFAAAASTGVRPMKPVASSRAQIDLRGAALNAEIERLHDRLRPSVAPEHGRNLFEFSHGRRSASPAATAAPVVAVAPPPAPVEPAFKLIGIAEDNGARTAILSSPSQLLMVHEGDNVVTGGSTYRVSGISADAVELKSTSDESLLRLALK
jgi:hypothetical protein